MYKNLLDMNGVPPLEDFPKLNSNVNEPEYHLHSEEFLKDAFEFIDNNEMSEYTGKSHDNVSTIITIKLCKNNEKQYVKKQKTLDNPFGNYYWSYFDGLNLYHDVNY